MANVVFYRGTSTPTTSTLSDGGIYFNTSNKNIYLNSGGTLYTFAGTDTKNTAGSSNTSSKIYLVGATSQATNPQTYSHDTAYVGTDGYLYSGGAKTIVYKSSWATTVSGAPSATSANSLGRYTTKVYLPNGYVPMGKITLSVTKQSGGTNSTATGTLGMTTTGTDTGRYFASITLTGTTSAACNDEGEYAAPTVTANVSFSGYFAYYTS